MITIILGMIIIALLVVLVMKFKKFSIIEFFGVLAIVLVMFGMAVITTAPIHGYEERVLSEEIHIAALTIDGVIETNHLVYLSVSDDLVYSYKVKGDAKMSFVNEGKDKVEYIESEECERAVLRIYEAKAKNSLFNFSQEVKKEYEFYVPVDAVQEIS